MNTRAINPLLFSYGTTAGIAAVAKPTAMIITGQGGWTDPAYAAARAAGAEVMAYIDPVEVPIVQSSLSSPLYAHAKPWPYYPRMNTATTMLADITAGSIWSYALIQYVQDLMTSRVVDGTFLDVLGARLWSPMSNWDAWPQEEKDAWTAGCVDLAQKLDALRRKINPEFILVNNNTWDRGDALGTPGEAAVNGVCLEHIELNDYHTAYAARPFCGFKRRLLVIARSTADAQAWAHVDGATHISDAQNYMKVSAPCVPYTRLDCSRVP